MLLNKKAQSTLEYAVIIAVVVAALIAMQAYLKRGLQGKIKQSSDDIGEQFSPGQTTANTSITSNVSSTEKVTVADEKPTTATTSTQSQNRTHSESVGAEKDEWWGGAAK